MLAPFMILSNQGWITALLSFPAFHVNLPPRDATLLDFRIPYPLSSIHTASTSSLVIGSIKYWMALNVNVGGFSSCLWTMVTQFCQEYNRFKSFIGSGVHSVQGFNWFNWFNWFKCSIGSRVQLIEGIVGSRVQ